MNNSTKKAKRKVITFVQPGKLKCFACGKSDHREIAKYCTECGSELLRLKNYNP